ncbi:myosin heavy chain, striated muscle isoform X7 [Megalobrama amblycephala]|uniref:myosin heavy chain, striated muscle isoform X7 n=1 Tax=Megalobrama amblycephala TaxID=75352 RepID=UPI00201456EA|nr:myosin heavy chain, striated muscle isoform X7 [Megalobrama amblycephala]
MMEASQDVVQEQPEESLSDQSTNAKVEEREALILELQDVITELHQEMSLKEQHELLQLQQLLQLEARVKELQEQVQGSEETIAQLRLELAERAQSNSGMLNVASTDLTALRGTQLLKTELSEVKGNLVKVQVENEALLEIKRHQATEVDRVSAELSLVRSTVLQKCKEAQEAKKNCHELEDELSVVRAHLSRCQEGKQDAKNRAELIQWLEDEVSRLKSQHSSVCQQESCGLQRAREELTVREKEWRKERSSLQEQLNSIRKELHSATIREEEHRLKVLQIDELQREVDKTLALLEKEREDCVKAEELERLREDQLKDKVRHQEEQTAELQRGFDQKEKRAEGMERAMVLHLREPPARTHTAPAGPGQPRPGRQQPETTAGEELQPAG